MDDSYGVYLKNRRMELGWSQARLARTSGISQGSISRIEKGVQKNLTLLTKQRLETALGSVDVPSDLVPYEMPARRGDFSIKDRTLKYGGRFVPVLAAHRIGQYEKEVKAFEENSGLGYEQVYCDGRPGPLAFGLVLDSDVMAPMFLAGDVLIIDPDAPCRPDDPCAVLLKEGPVVRILVESDRQILLVPKNPEYSTLMIPKDSETKYRIIGRVVRMSRRFSL